MSQKILLYSSGRFIGPFTDNRSAVDGQTITTLTDPQYAQLFTLGPNPLAKDKFFDASAGPTWFRLGALDECATYADTLQKALIFLVEKITSDAKFARVMSQFSAATTFFKSYGPDCGIMRSRLKQFISDIDVAGDTELAALKAQMLSLPHWNA